MAKVKEVFVCQSCGTPLSKWQGQCAGCGEWNTLVAEVQSAPPRAGRRAPWRPATPPVAGRRGRATSSRAIATGSGRARPGAGRRPGGGLGDPDRRRSRHRQIHADAAGGRRARMPPGRSCTPPARSRSSRWRCGPGVSALPATAARLIAETQVEAIIEAARALKARVLIVDSIQTMYSERIETAPGAVSQLRECTAELVRFAKSSGTAVLLVGHVTKEGQIAGPRVLEHMVDTVLYFESDTGSRFRVLRSVKNRFGAANEIGVFAMAEQGLREVTNPSAIFLSRHPDPYRQRRHGDARRNAFAAHRGAGAGRPVPRRQSAPRRGRHRRQPPDHAARRGTPPCGTFFTPGRVRQRGGRRSARGNRGRSRDRAGRALEPHDAPVQIR